MTHRGRVVSKRVSLGAGGRPRLGALAWLPLSCGIIALAACKTNDLEVGADLPLTDDGRAGTGPVTSSAQDAAPPPVIDAGPGIAGAGGGAVDAGAALGCADGFADCDGDPANACETNLKSDNAHCGQCGMVCPTGFNIESNGATCIDGVCVHACHLLHADCDGNLANGCETNTWISNEHCGACGVACTCLNGQCM